MKVNSPTPLFSTLDRVRGSESSGNAPKRENGQGQNAKKDDSQKESGAAEFAVDSEQGQAELNKAIDEFAHAKSVTSNGLQAEVLGQGPGLRVTLKDGQGAVVRQFTGEEFLRLREAASGAGRGRLLDKKL